MRRSSNIKALLVEFVGPAGVGKSFLVEKVSQALRSEGFPVGVFRTIEIVRWRPRVLMSVVHAAWLVALTKPSSFRKFWFGTKAVARHQLRWHEAKNQRQIQLCDEGVFHLLRTLHRSSGSMGMIELAQGFARHVALGKVVVVVTASAEKISERRVKREKVGDNLDRESVNRDIALLTDSLFAIAYIQQSYQPNLKVVLVNAEKDDPTHFVDNVASAAKAAFSALALGYGNSGT